MSFKPIYARVLFMVSLSLFSTLVGRYGPALFDYSKLLYFGSAAWFGVFMNLCALDLGDK